LPTSLQLHRKLAKYTDKVLHLLGMPALLRRAEGDRSCTVVLDQFSTRERAGRMLSPLAIKVLVSAKGLTAPPDTEKDRLVTLDPATKAQVYVYRIVAAPIEMGPAGVPMYWELAVEKL
jgi:hypothetical protein